MVTLLITPGFRVRVWLPYLGHVLQQGWLIGATVLGIAVGKRYSNSSIPKFKTLNTRL